MIPSAIQILPDPLIVKCGSFTRTISYTSPDSVVCHVYPASVLRRSALVCALRVMEEKRLSRTVSSTGLSWTVAVRGMGAFTVGGFWSIAARSLIKSGRCVQECLKRGRGRKGGAIPHASWESSTLVGLCNGLQEPKMPSVPKTSTSIHPPPPTGNITSSSAHSPP